MQSDDAIFITGNLTGKDPKEINIFSAATREININHFKSHIDFGFKDGLTPCCGCNITLGDDKSFYKSSKYQTRYHCENILQPSSIILSDDFAASSGEASNLERGKIRFASVCISVCLSVFLLTIK